MLQRTTNLHFPIIMCELVSLVEASTVAQHSLSLCEQLAIVPANPKSPKPVQGTQAGAAEGAKQAQSCFVTEVLCHRSIRRMDSDSDSASHTDACRQQLH